MIASEFGEEVLAAHALLHPRIAGDGTVTVQLSWIGGGGAREAEAPEPMTFAMLRRELGESAFTDLVVGSAVADYLFSDAPLGEPLGPWSGPEGSYLAVVQSRADATPAQLATPEAADRVREDYVRRRFAAWSNDVLIRTVMR